MIRNWIKMKKLELKCRLALYTRLASLLDEKEEIASLLGRIYTALKNTPAEELQSKLIAEIAELVHQEAARKSQ